MEARERFREYERTRSLRRSAGRERVAALAAALPGHFTAEELARRLARHRPAASRATVYRALPHLLAAGLIRDCGMINGNVVYERAAGSAHHDHLRCLACGRIIEFVDARIEALQAAACRQHGFTASGHRLEITGACRACASKRRRR